MAMAVAENKPHAVCIPYPAQSHIKGMMKLAKLLHHRAGIFLPPSDPNATHDVAALYGSVRRNFLTPFRNLLAKLNDDDNATPAVTCIVSDGVMPFSIKVADELRIPVAMFWTFAACGFMGFYQYYALLDKGLTPLKDASYLTNGYLDTVIDWIPGMKDIRLKDFPTFLQTADPNNEIFNLCMESAESASQASAIGLHTFDALEQDLLDTLSSMFPHVYTIGPLQLLLNQQVSPELESLGYNLWKEEAECLQWLDSKECLCQFWEYRSHVTTTLDRICLGTCQ
ncbi:7-deoxyloganetin glucosyltransferase-like [Camellia sinensis]|uniref:7-deoxyloganetin glucosyltransferase-like n=1 Tax=Camellia sinensis TaxID=4442 RepID=UPI0010357BC5|nr:7-deoxyloganetin glucosyltransferase-like [Camellia sinensis]